MPVRSSSSAVLKWPDRETVHDAAEAWAQRVGKSQGDVVRIGYFGSYAQGNWGVGSDLDFVVVVDSPQGPVMERGLRFRPSGIPVPCDVLTYTLEEWERLVGEGGRFARTVEQEAVWIYHR